MSTVPDGKDPRRSPPPPYPFPIPVPGTESASLPGHGPNSRAMVRQTSDHFPPPGKKNSSSQLSCLKAPVSALVIKNGRRKHFCQIKNIMKMGAHCPLCFFSFQRRLDCIRPLQCCSYPWQSRDAIALL